MAINQNILKVLLLFLFVLQAHAKIEIYGHRGAAGLAPENTIPGFRTALSIGVDVIDIDVGLTKDGVVVATHDFNLNPDLTRLESVWLNKLGPAVVASTFNSLLQYDVGRIAPDSYYHQHFPNQVGFDKTRIPSLSEVVRYVKQHAKTPVRFQIELKTTPHKSENMPKREALVEAVLNVLKQEKIIERTEIQSFDWSALVMIKSLEPAVTLSFITLERGDFDNVRAGYYGDQSWTAGHQLSEYGNSIPKMILALGGSVWTPYFKNLTPALLKEAQALGLRVVPWSVDKENDMSRMIEMSVDGIITNRPDVLRGMLAAYGKPLPTPSTIQQ